MSRAKEFSRNEVLEQALPVFWTKGFSATALSDLERATGVNKSGLYSEFKDKEDLFLASLHHYYDKRPNREILKREAQGWKNVEDYLKFSTKSPAKGPRGCFAVNTLRELGGLSAEAEKIIELNRTRLKKLICKNIANEKTKLAPEAIADLVLTFHFGLQIEQNMSVNAPAIHRRIDDFLRALRLL